MQAQSSQSLPLSRKLYLPPHLSFSTYSEKCPRQIVQNKSGSSYMRDKFHHESFSPNDTIDLYISRILLYQERLANTRKKLDNFQPTRPDYRYYDCCPTPTRRDCPTS
ncbi:hypothetical protein L211DRAFT_215889 [Terfezia boudieri ATCC MYA-4762]|uniref:Uncharacterized protein n=1 Tax=Terfezia boudieri ATCC MYA-4762 TaxID=1051890 RepID=A0A3N4LLA0_9PEZI|nr:hypothetical protein L211DRAFT_215889 [Terfezia boudieri ATCC MYA-4762]